MSHMSHTTMFSEISAEMKKYNIIITGYSATEGRSYNDILESVAIIKIASLSLMSNICFSFIELSCSWCLHLCEHESSLKSQHDCKCIHA